MIKNQNSTVRAAAVEFEPCTMKEENPDEIEEMGSIMVGDNNTMDLIYECETKRVQELLIF